MNKECIHFFGPLCILNFIKILPVEVELFHTDGQTDGREKS